jgi:hypothetical protein
MTVEFFEGRNFPRELRQMSQYGDTYAPGQSVYTETRERNAGDAIADIFRSLTTGAVDFFGGSTSEAKIAAANAAQMQAQIYGAQEVERAKTLRTVAIVGAGVVGLLVIIIALKPKPAPKMAGHRRNKRRRR